MTEVKKREPLSEDLLLRKGLLESKLGLSAGRLKIPSSSDRVCDSEKGLSLYDNMPSWGVKLPLSEFVQSLIRALNVSLSQISGTSWCIINSFEHLFSFYADKLRYCRVKKPTLNLFFHYYTFISDKGWLTCCKRKRLPNKPEVKLLKPISKVQDWKNAFFFLPPDVNELDSMWRGSVNPSWNLQVTVPGKKELTEEEKKVVRIFYSLSKGISVHLTSLYLSSSIAMTALNIS